MTTDAVRRSTSTTSSLKGDVATVNAEQPPVSTERGKELEEGNHKVAMDVLCAAGQLRDRACVSTQLRVLRRKRTMMLGQVFSAKATSYRLKLFTKWKTSQKEKVVFNCIDIITMPPGLDPQVTVRTLKSRHFPRGFLVIPPRVNPTFRCEGCPRQAVRSLKVLWLSRQPKTTFRCQVPRQAVQGSIFCIKAVVFLDNIYFFCL